MKKTFFYGTIITVISLCILLANKGNNNKKLAELVLANIEALTQQESQSYYAERVSSTWQEGPFYNKAGNEIKEYYWIITQVECLGKGVVECESDYSAEIKYVN